MGKLGPFPNVSVVRDACIPSHVVHPAPSHHALGWSCHLVQPKGTVSAKSPGLGSLSVRPILGTPPCSESQPRAAGSLTPPKGLTHAIQKLHTPPQAQF